MCDVCGGRAGMAVACVSSRERGSWQAAASVGGAVGWGDSGYDAAALCARAAGELKHVL